jgi:NADPH:quinone reductase-like Zn-dependent oxidoreductase
MRLYRIPRATGIDSLTLAEADIPQPQRGQVLVRMHAASLNYRDLMIVNGRAARQSRSALGRRRRGGCSRSRRDTRETR